MNIASIIHSRPDLTRIVFEEIRRAKPRQLFVIADGPRTPEQESICAETREITDNVDWECQVHRDAGEHLGIYLKVSQERQRLQVLKLREGAVLRHNRQLQQQPDFCDQQVRQGD